MQKTNKNSLLGNLVLNKLVFLIIIMLMLLLAGVSAATNVSVLYGWNGTSNVPIQVDAGGRLKTTLNLTKSTGLFPESDSAYDLGSTSLRWKTGYIVDLVSAGSINVGGSLNATSINTTGSAYFATSSGKVGIGATSPNTTLHVSGTANITGTLSVGSFEISNAGIGSMNVSGRTLLGINGIVASVGIHTLTPLSRLHVNDSSEIGAFRVTNVSGTTLFFINGSSGKVGVKTTDPDTEFKVAGDTNVTGSLWVQGENVTAPTNVSMNYVYNGSEFVGAKATGAGILQLDVVSQSADKALTSFTVTDNLIVDTNTLVVNASSNKVGIGTISPAEKLVVIGNANVSGTLNVSGRVAFPNLASCDTIDTDANGVLSCGTDTGGGGTNSSLWNISGSNIFQKELSNNVGIGDTTPSDALEVIGNVRVSGSLNASSINATSIKVGTNDVQTVNAVFNKGNYSTEYAASGFKIVNFTDEYASTGYKKTNYSSEYAASGFDNENFTTRYDARADRFLIANFTSNLNTQNASLWNASGSNIYLKGQGGNVGIGTSKPGSALTIMGNEITSNAILHLNASDNFNTSVVNMLTLDHVLKNAVNSTGGVGVGILFRAMDNTSQLEPIANISAVLYNATNGSELSALTFSTRGNEITDFPQGLVERMRIDGHGRVGINTTTINETLVVVGTLDVVSGSGTQGLFQDSSGKVGIGTKIPNTELEVNGTSTFGGNVNVPKNDVNVGGGYSSGGVTLVGQGTDLGTGQFGKDILLDGDIISVYDVEINQSFVPTKDKFSLLGNVSQRFLDAFVINIKAANETLNLNANVSVVGNLSVDDTTFFVDAYNNRVGIGTRSPAEKLVVIGSVNISDSLNVSGTVQATTFIGDGSKLTGISTGQIWNSSGTNVFLNDSTAKVGIGTTSPTEILEVGGNVRVSGNITGTSFGINETSTAVVLVATGSKRLILTTNASTWT